MKKIKKIFASIILLFAFAKNTAQTVSLNVSTVNGTSLSAGSPINFGSSTTANVTLSTQVNISPSPSDSYPGTIKIFYQKNNLYPSVLSSSGGNLLFYGGTSAVRNFTITLSASQFDPSGGYLYSEYETYSGIKYKSSNIAIIKNAPATGGNPIYSSNLYFYETVPYGGIPILPKITNDGLEWYTFNTSTLYENRRTNRAYASAILEQKNPLFGNSPCKLFSMNVNRPFSNISRLYIENNIASDQYVEYGGNAQTLNGNSAFISSVNPTISLNNYQWQKRKIGTLADCSDYSNYMVNHAWTDIPNAILQNYTPNPSIVNEATEYRRLVIENPTQPLINRRAASSNVVRIIPINSTNISNTICCDQTLYSNTTINQITGSSPTLSNKFYQWQIGYLNTDSSITWEDIPNSNTINYTPTRPSIGRIGSITLKYRRMVISNTTLLRYPSNIITYTFYNVSGRYSSNSSEFKNENEIINIYPNPSSTKINIESNIDFSAFNIKIFDLTGRKIFDKNNNDITIESIDISSFPIGVYTLIIENSSKKIIKKIIKE